jgi:hypothetical protein
MQKRQALTLVLAAAFVGGCTFLEKTPEPVAAPPLKAAPPPPVRAGDITPSNAREKARQLNDEIDRDIDGERVQ